ncbi:MAG: hypothetical protein DRJ03_27710 [Chloroflexi bacterium]|nr:MAG: hypothetical protein DRJ03_27710 [Chloroflexota bacterium]
MKTLNGRLPTVAGLVALCTLVACAVAAHTMARADIDKNGLATKRNAVAIEKLDARTSAVLQGLSRIEGKLERRLP